MSRLVSLVLISGLVATAGYAQEPNRGTTSAPAQYQMNLADAVSGQLNYKADAFKFYHIRGSRFTTLSNLMPIAEFNPMMVAPTQDYIYYKTYDTNLLDPLRVSNGIETNPGYPSPPTPVAPFTQASEFKARLINGYIDAHDGWHNAFGAIYSNPENRVILMGMRNEFEDSKLSDGRTLVGSQADRDSLMFSYGRRMGDHTLSYSYLNTEIKDAGIPAGTLDVANADVTAHIVSYDFTGELYRVSGELRKIDLERTMDDYNYRPWLPTGARPGNPFLDPDAINYFGEINSLVDQGQEVDGWEYRLAFSRPLFGGAWTAGIDGVMNDIALDLTKPWDDPRFENVPTNPFTPVPLLAPQDWRHFGIFNDIEENAYSFFSEIDKPLSEKSSLHLGARMTLHDLDTSLSVQPDGVDGRIVYDVLGLRYMLENVYGVVYLPPAERDCATSQPPCSTGTYTPVDRKYDDETFDLVGRFTHQLNDRVTLSATASWFEEQPAAFERTFAAGFDPASDTIDGQIYFGNPHLTEEQHGRLEFAAAYDNQRNFYAQARVWYDHVDDYIQGVPIIETTRDPAELESAYELACNTLLYAPPMTGLPPLSTEYGVDFDCLSNNPLRYDNIDARLYGADFAWGYQISDSLLFSGVAAYQRGKRRDTGWVHVDTESDLFHPGTGFVPGGGESRVIDEDGIVAVRNDDLYRIMPAYAQMALTYAQPKWQASLEGTFFARQDKVSFTNQEAETSGYGVYNAIFSYTPHPAIRVDMGINNLFDKDYTNHLTGVNRRFNYGQDPNALDYNERIPGLGRNAFIKLTLGYMKRFD
jgi:iron complex outermembrane receptor protein